MTMVPLRIPDGIRLIYFLIFCMIKLQVLFEDSDHEDGEHPMLQTQQEIRISSFGALLSGLDASEVDCVYRVSRLGAKSAQYVLLLKDGGYLCTCLLLQNMGTVCRHFFFMMRKDPAFKYHIQLVRARWLQEQWQDREDIDLASRPFLSSTTHQHATDKDQRPGPAYMRVIPQLFPSTSDIPAVKPRELAKQSRYADLHNQSKELLRVAADNPVLAETVRKALDEAAVKLRTQIEARTGRLRVKDPVIWPAAGKVSNKRIKSSREISMDSKFKARKRDTGPRSHME